MAAVGEAQLQVELVRHNYDRLRGRLFEMFEAMGLPEQQERAAKGLVRTLTYSDQAALESIIRRKERADARSTAD